MESHMTKTKTEPNSKEKGTAGVGSAIQYFTMMWVTVSVPLNDSQGYDLIADYGYGQLKRVQVKTTNCKASANSWEVPLRTTGGNQSFHTAKAFDKTSCDLLFVVTGDGRRWLIPVEKIAGTNSISVGHKNYSEFEIKIM